MLNITDEKLLQLIKDEDLAQMMIEICITMYEMERPKVNIGGLLRLAGLDNSIAEEYDTQAFLLDETFYENIEQAIEESEAEAAELAAAVAPDYTVH